MKRWTAAAFGALAGAMIVYPGEAAEAAFGGLSLWARAVAPVLGPFMACMLMLTTRVGGGLWLRVGLSWLCGSPGGARLMQTIHPKGRLALRCAALTGTMSPMFFLGTISAWLGNPTAGRVILACHWTGALLTGLCIPAERGEARAVAAPLPLSAALRESALALLNIALCMMLGCVAARMAACALPGLPREAAALIQCALEVTAGVRAVIDLGSPLVLPLVCAACSFGGLSLLMQNAAFWQESPITMGGLFSLRLIHGVLSGIICYLAASILPAV